MYYIIIDFNLIEHLPINHSIPRELSMSEFVLYGTPVSPFVRKVEAVLNLTGATYEFVNVNIMDKPEWFLEISPARRIPVLRDKSIGDTGANGTIADSSAICLYLDKKLNVGLYGATPFDAGRVAFLEEYADSELAQPLGMKLFRPIMFPRFAGKPSDLETARQTYNEVLPKHFDYLENTLNDRDFFVGEKWSLADIAIGSQLTQLNLVAGLPDPSRWPSLAKHTESMAKHPCLTNNLTACQKILNRFLPKKVDLS
jgi:glutathione S-transferase